MVAAVVAVAVVAGGGATAVATSSAQLRTAGPTSVSGTDATAVFEIADRTIRQIRYLDRGELVYTFDLENAGSLPVTVTGLGDSVEEPRLFDLVSLSDDSGHEEFTIGAGDTEQVALAMTMTDCETLSARAGSIVDQVAIRTEGLAGLGRDEVVVELPEEIRAGSPREAGCANATATSRPPG